MSFESLANELILDLFEYFNAFELFHLFHHLNIRFDHLLFEHFLAYHFDLRSISKDEFIRISTDYLPLIFNRISSLKLSNHNETPELISSFPLNRCSRLKSLSLFSIDSLDLFDDILHQCEQLIDLRHLKFNESFIENEKLNFNPLIGQIWSLKRLKSCSVDCHSPSRMWFTKMSIVSWSIRTLAIENISCTIRDLLNLLQHTPRLHSLSITIIHSVDNDCFPSQIFPSLRSLELTFESSMIHLTKIFALMPNLRSLALKTFDLLLNGRQWKRIFRHYFLHLNSFHLRMYFEFASNRTVDEQMKKLIDSYRTSFWIKEHQWFVQCDSIPFGSYHHGILFTLPYHFETCLHYNIAKSIFTCPDEQRFWLFDRVIRLRYMNCPMTNELQTFLPIRYPNIQYLKIVLPFDERFSSLFSSLYRLTHLEVIVSENETENQLEMLVNTCVQIESLDLYISRATTVVFPLMNIYSSIRRLNFIPKSLSGMKYFSEGDTMTLAQSSLSHHCEVLTIPLEHRRIALGVIQTMTHLRTLIIQCHDDQDDLLPWFTQSLPSSYSITRNRQLTSQIRIWISRPTNQT